MTDIAELERRILNSEHKVIARDAVLTVLAWRISRVIELERELHQLKLQTLYEPPTSPQNDTNLAASTTGHIRVLGC